MKRVLRYIVIALAALVVLVALAWWWLTGTSSGASFLLGQAQSRLEKLEYDRLEGALSDGLVLHDVQFEQAGLKATVGRLELAVGIRPLPTRVTVRRLSLNDVELTLPPPAPDAPEPEPFEPGDYGAPVEVVVDDFALVDFVLLAAAGDAPLLEIQRAALSGRYAEALEIESLALETAPYSLSASGRLGLSAPWTTDLELEADWVLEEATTQGISAEITGTLAALDLQLEGRGPLQASVDATVGGLPAIDAMDGSVTLTGELDGWPGIAGRIENVELQAEGSLQAWQAELAGRVEWPEQPAVDVVLVADGTEDTVTVSRGDLSLLDGVVRVTGSAGLGDPMTADAQMVLENLDFTAMYPDWPAQARLSGGLDATWDGQVLRVAEVDLRAPPAPLTLTGSGSLDSRTESLEVALEWASLVWPPVLDDTEPLFSSESGRLEAGGTLSEWRAELEAWMTAPGQPRARLEVRADGNTETAQLRTGRVVLDEVGELAVTGSIGFAGSPTADLNLVMTDFDPGAWVAQMPGSINADLGLELTQLQPLVAGIAINRLDGTLRNQPLAGSGGLSLRDTLVERADLEIKLGQNEARLTTDGGEAWQLQLEADRLAQLWPDLSGEVSLNAGFDPGRKSLDWNLQSPGIAWLDFRTGTLESTGLANWGDNESVEASINAVDVDLNPWERLDRVEVTLAGNCRAHALGTYFSGTRATLDFELDGMLPECLDDPGEWSGQVARMVISETPLGTWQLDEDMPLSLSDGVVSAGPGCLWTPAGSGRLCLNELAGGASGQAALAFNSVPLDLLLLPTDPVFTLGSDLRGIAEVRWTPDGVENIDAELLVSPGAARMLEGEEDLIRIRGARLGLHSPQPGALDAALVLRLEAESELVASASIPDLNAPKVMQLDASANLSLPNLGALNRLVPQLDQLAGKLDGEFRLSGPLSSPDFDGRVAISDGEFLHAPLGARVTALSLILEADEDGGRISGDFMAGEGRAELEGDLDLKAADGWRGNLSLAGNDLKLFSVDWLELTVTPDLVLGFRPERLEMNGSLEVDRARLGMPPGSEQRIAASSDVVVVGEQDDQEEEEALPVRDIVGTVRIGLSDDVRLAAAGLETNVAGELNVEWVENKTLPSARGTLRLVDGSYSAYGQNLEVTEGDVVFTGNPVDNPILEIEAVRDIFGDPQVERAGVRIRGPAQDPEINLFTAPPTSREKALAYILTGADFDHASGQGAFSVGFWVLPNVFVSYGLGLFDTGNVLAARWELSRRWGLRATSGERDTGADLSFIIDR